VANGTTRNEEARAIVGERQPNERFVTVEEIGDLVRFLIEGEGAASITGAAMPVDGAWTAQ